MDMMFDFQGQKQQEQWWQQQQYNNNYDNDDDRLKTSKNQPKESTLCSTVKAAKLNEGMALCSEQWAALAAASQLQEQPNKTSIEEATINQRSYGNNIYIWFSKGSAASTTRSYWIIGSTDGSEQQAAKEATTIASAASTVEPGNCNHKLFKRNKNQLVVTAMTAMGLARSWPSKHKRWQKQGTSSSEARQQWLQQQPKQDSQPAPNNCENNGKWQLQGFGNTVEQQTSCCNEGNSS